MINQNILRALSLTFLFSCTQILSAENTKGLWAFGGIGLGGTLINTDETNPVANPINPGLGEVDKTGFNGHIKAGLSWYLFKNFVADAMIGYELSKVKGSGPSGGADVDIEHRVGLFQLSPRYRFDESGQWQLGPLYKLAFGTDTNYTEREGQYAGEKPSTHYLGLHLNYDIPSRNKNLIYRLGAEALTDISDNRDIYKLNLLFEIGFQLWSPSPAQEAHERIPVTTEEIEAIEEPDNTVEELLPVEVPTEKQIQTYVEKDNLRIRFPGDIFRFSTGMSHIESQQSKEYLIDLGKFLEKNTQYWQNATVVGHTDRRGPKGRERVVNQELSEARAKTVRNALVYAGVAANKINSEGKAFDEPVDGARDNPAGWRLNRRVELTLFGVSAPQNVQKQIDALNRKYKY